MLGHLWNVVEQDFHRVSFNKQLVFIPGWVEFVRLRRNVDLNLGITVLEENGLAEFSAQLGVSLSCLGHSNKFKL